MVRVGDREELQDLECRHLHFPELQEEPELLQDREQEDQVVPVEVEVLLHLAVLVEQDLRMAAEEVEEVEVVVQEERDLLELREVQEIRGVPVVMESTELQVPEEVQIRVVRVVQQTRYH
jgi:hypothetical protein